MKRLNIKIYGIVQGVGFRPFVSRLADACQIRGTVCNKGPYVEVFAEGNDAALQQFVEGIPKKAPERAAILKVDVHEVTDAAPPYADLPSSRAPRSAATSSSRRTSRPATSAALSSSTPKTAATCTPSSTARPAARA